MEMELPLLVRRASGPTGHERCCCAAPTGMCSWSLLSVLSILSGVTVQEAEHSRPFFIALLGERYGWIPPNYRVSDRPEFDWIRSYEPGHSITEMECRFGFLTHYYRPVHAFAYKRDAAFLGEIPAEAPERRIFAFDYQGNDEITERRNAFLMDVERHPYCKNYTYCESDFEPGCVEPWAHAGLSW